MKRKNWPEQLHLLAASVIFLAILVLVYQIADRHNRRLDLTREKIHSISRETVEVLRRMERNDIRVRAFFAEGDPARRDFELLLKEVATHHPHFRYEFLDPDRSPSEARRFRVTSYQTALVEYENRQERFQGFAEEPLTNALFRLAHPQTQTVCFTEGHGEIPFSAEERTSLSEWRRVLEDYHYQVREIQITSEGIPADCDAVVMAGPHYELLRTEIEILRRYPEKGKGFFLLVDPMDPGTGTSFIELLESFGVTLGGDVVVDKVSRIFGVDFLSPLITQYAPHPITKRFRAATFFPIARTIATAPEPPGTVKITELVRTNPGSWAERDLKRLENGEAEMDPKADLAGPVSLAAAVEFPKEAGGARWVVVGDSDFVVNAYLGVSGNKDFALNILQWLVQDDRWISVRVKASRFEPLFLKVHQGAGVAAFALGGLPLSALVVGSVGIFQRRRKSK
jgi:ABC-type uncharacterized transport system involved in gliding motility auxiliary subunit